VNAQPRFDNATPLRASPARTNVAEDAAVSSRSSLMAARPALASMMFVPSSKFSPFSVEPDLGKDLHGFYRSGKKSGNLIWPEKFWENKN